MDISVKTIIKSLVLISIAFITYLQLPHYQENLAIHFPLWLVMAAIVYKFSHYGYQLVKTQWVAKRHQLQWQTQKQFFPQLSKKKQAIAHLSIPKLLKKYGSPLYIVDQQALEKKYHAFKTICTRLYPNHQLAYSIKTNNVLGVCQLYKQLGAHAEVVSEHEYFFAKKLGYRGDQIIYNGPYKSPESLKTALKEKAKIHIDNWEEWKQIQYLTKNKSQIFNLGIRINTSFSGLPSRFGFDPQDLKKLVECIQQQANLKISGIHMHLGTNITSPRFYKKAIEGLAKSLNKTPLSSLEYLDLGGGFPVYEKHKPQMSWFSYSIEDFLQTIQLCLEKNRLSYLQLVFEPGRFLVDQGVACIATIINVKSYKNIQMLTTDLAVGMIPRAFWKSLPVSLANINQFNQVPTTIYGPSCMEGDCLNRDIYLPKAQVGDQLVFWNAGAYTIAQANQFIFPKPRVIAITTNNGASIVKVLQKKSDEKVNSLDL